MGSWLTYEDFAPLLGATFTADVADGDSTVSLVLAEATDKGSLATASDGRTRGGFSLVFRGPADVPLEQGTYELRNDALGCQLIFVVPVGADENARYYEAVFA